MTDTSQPKPADKVWARYDGPNCPDYIEGGKWYEVDDFGPRFRIASMKEVGISSWGNWQRHVGPTPPGASPAVCSERLTDQEIEALKANPVIALQPNRLPPIVRGPTPPDASPASGTKVVGGAIIFDKDAKKWVLETTVASDEWRIHDGSDKRPDRVGKRDKVEVVNHGPFGVGRGESLACDAVWNIVTRYRITERAPKKEKRRKAWVVEAHGDILGAWHSKAVACAVLKQNGGTLYTAKLTPVKDTDK